MVDALFSVGGYSTFPRDVVGIWLEAIVFILLTWALLVEERHGFALLFAVLLLLGDQLDLRRVLAGPPLGTDQVLLNIGLLLTLVVGIAALAWPWARTKLRKGTA
jgi:hypothetical protein